MPTNSFVEFLLFIIPGFLYVKTFRSFHPVEKESHFFEIANTTVFGVFIYVVIKSLDSKIFNYFLATNNNNPSFKFILTLLGTGVLLGTISHLIYELRFWTAKKFDFLNWLAPDDQTIWKTVNHKNITDWSVVHLNNGAIYSGYIKNYTYNPNSDNQDFLLSKAKRVDENLKEIYLIDGIGVYLNTRDINRVEFVKGS